MRSASLLALLLLCACTRSTAEVKKETKEAVEAAAKLVTGTKDDYVARTEARLRDIEARLEVLRADVDKKSGEAKASAERQLEALRKQKDELARELETLKRGTAEGWRDTQRKLEATADAFERSFDDLKKRLEAVK